MTTRANERYRGKDGDAYLAMRSSASFKAIWIILAVLALLLTLGRVSRQQHDDDNIWLAYSGMPPSAVAKAIEGEFVARVSATAQCTTAAFRMKLRDRYAANYGGYLLLNSAVYAVRRSFEGEGLETAWRALATTRALMLLLSSLFLLTVALALKPDLALAVAGAIAAMAASDLVVNGAIVPDIGIVDMADAGNLPKLVFSFFFATEAHSIFGATPRNAALSLFAAAMVLRWQRRPAAGAIAILLAGAMHQTYGGISLLLFTVTTAIASPDQLKGRATQVLLTLAAVIYAMRERYVTVDLAIQAAVLIAVVTAATLAFTAVRSGPYARLRTRMLGMFADRELLLDAATCILLCTVVTVAALIAARRSEPTIALYFWSDLTIRLWSFARFPVFVGAAMLVVKALARQFRWLETAGALLCLILVLVSLRQIDVDGLRDAPSQASIAAYDAGYPGLRLPKEERVIYANLALVTAGAQPAAELRRRLAMEALSCANYRGGAAVEGT